MRYAEIEQSGAISHIGMIQGRLEPDEVRALRSAVMQNGRTFVEIPDDVPVPNPLLQRWNEQTESFDALPVQEPVRGRIPTRELVLRLIERLDPELYKEVTE